MFVEVFYEFIKRENSARKKQFEEKVSKDHAFIQS